MVPSPRLLPFLALLVLGAPAGATTLDLSLQLDGAGSAVIGPVQVELRPLGGTGPARREALSAPGRKLLEVAPETRWSLEVRAEGFWAPPLTLTAARTGLQPVTVRLYGRSRVLGELALPSPGPPPGALRLQWTAAGSRTPRSFESVCPVRDGRFDCPAPAGRWDLRARARGHVSHFFWGAALHRGKPLRLGVLRLQRGASVTGWVVRTGNSSASTAAGSCKIRLAPQATGPSPAAADAGKRLDRTTVADARGFFHLAGVAPGTYRVTAEQAGFAPASFFPLTVLADSESALREPLVLRPPLRLAVQIDPPLTPLGRPWHLSLASPGPSGLPEPRFSDPVAPSGLWTRAGLAPGTYTVLVADESGSTWLGQEIDVQAGEDGEARIHLDLDVVEIEGNLRLGREPLSAKLWFGGRSGAPGLALESDEKGDFSGFLPREGLWQVDVAAADPVILRTLRGIEVRRPKGRRAARVDLELPDGRASGTVVDAQGEPVRGAVVRLEIPERIEQADQESGEDGRFAFRGLPAGTVRLSAATQFRRSKPAEIRLDGRSAAPAVRLTLRDLRSLRGSVAGTGGGVPGASILARHPDQLETDTATTDAAGSFTLTTSRSPFLDLIFLPPGYALRTLRLTGEAPSNWTVPVETHGGTLQLEDIAGFDPDLPPSSLTFVLHQGIPLHLPVLAQWAQLNGLTPSAATGRLVVPQMEAGDYALCRIPASRLPELSRGIVSPARCSATGYLAPGGQLTLRLGSSSTSRR